MTRREFIALVGGAAAWPPGVRAQHIGAPVAQYISDLASMTVGAERAKAKSAMTVQDLLRHASGFTYAMFGDSAVQMIWRDANLQANDQTNDKLVAKLAKLPLLFEPGTTWEYQVSRSEAETSKKWTASLPACRSKSRGNVKIPSCYGAKMELAQSSIDEPAASRARPRSWLCAQTLCQGNTSRSLPVLHLQRASGLEGSHRLPGRGSR
jgi:hypothetical protein